MTGVILDGAQFAQLEAIADCTPQQWSAARRYLTQHAPDLLEIFAETSEGVAS